MKKVRNILSTFCFVTAAVALPAKSQAGEILFAMVTDAASTNSNVYATEGLSISNMLGGTGSGYNVTTHYLSQSWASDWGTGYNTLGDYLFGFDQIFVYDLSADGNHHDKTDIHIENYNGIIDWYRNPLRQNKNLIMDGRILASCASSTFWACSDADGEKEYIQSYRDFLDDNGGGLILGTDHDEFAHGINYIANGIGVGSFQGKYDHMLGHGNPEAIVDPSSPFYSTLLKDCTSDPGKKCISNNTSSSYAPTGLQSNGQTLNAVAYHQGFYSEPQEDYGNAAVSMAMGGFTAVSEPLPIALLLLGLAGLQLQRRFCLKRAACPTA